VDEFARIQSSNQSVLTYTGTLYPEQHIEEYLNAIGNFNESGRGSCAVVLCGRHDPAEYERWPFVHVLGRVAHQTSLFLQSRSTALFYPTWPSTDSVYSGKIFELLVSGLPVLVGFTPSPDLESLCRNFKTVSVIKGPEELIEVLAQLPYLSVDCTTEVAPAIATKKYWAGELAGFLDEILDRRKANNVRSQLIVSS
jgi:hypothetical protein